MPEARRTRYAQVGLGIRPLGRAADHRAGAWSILTGIAANRSITTGERVRVDELVTGLALP